ERGSQGEGRMHLGDGGPDGGAVLPVSVAKVFAGLRGELLGLAEVFFCGHRGTPALVVRYRSDTAYAHPRTGNGQVCGTVRHKRLGWNSGGPFTGTGSSASPRAGSADAVTVLAGSSLSAQSRSLRVQPQGPSTGDYYINLGHRPGGCAYYHLSTV